MSIVLLVSTEEQLRSGVTWGVRFAESQDCKIHVIVLGSDRQVLVKQAETWLTKQLKESHCERGSVTEVAPSIDAINELLHQYRCRWLVLMHGLDGIEFQKQLFQQAPVSSIWLRPAASPPINEAHVIGLFADQQRLSKSLCRELLEMTPHEFAYSTPDDCRPIRSDTDRSDTGGEVAEVDVFASATLENRKQADDLLLVALQSVSDDDPRFTLALRLIHSSSNTSVALVRRGAPAVQSVADRIQRWAATIAPPMSRKQRVDLSNDLVAGSQANWEYLGLISASAMLAAFGLLQDSAAVIIGAMLIAPLMTPILGVGMSLSRGDQPLFRSAWLTILLGFVGALSASILFGLLVVVCKKFGAMEEITLESTPEMWSRCRPSPLDFCVGTVGGIAASYARTRSHLSSALAGAAIAAALVPPISTAGLQIAFWSWESGEKGVPVFGPLVLVTINVLTIMAGSSFVLWARGIRADRKLDLRSRWTLRMGMLLLTIVLLILAVVFRRNVFLPA